MKIIELKKKSSTVSMGTAKGRSTLVIEETENPSKIIMQESIKEQKLNILQIKIAGGVSSVIFDILFTLAAYSNTGLSILLVDEMTRQYFQRLSDAINFNDVKVAYGNFENVEKVLNSTEHFSCALKLAKEFVEGFDDGIIERKSLEGTPEVFMESVFSNNLLKPGQRAIVEKDICDEKYFRENMFVIECSFKKNRNKVTFLIAEYEKEISAYVIQTEEATISNSEKQSHVEGILLWVQLARFIITHANFKVSLCPLTVPIEWYCSSRINTQFNPPNITPASRLCKAMRKVYETSNISVGLTRESKTVTKISAKFEGKFTCDMIAILSENVLTLTNITISSSVSTNSLTIVSGTLCAWLALAVALSRKQLRCLYISGTENTLHVDLIPETLAFNGFTKTENLWAYDTLTYRSTNTKAPKSILSKTTKIPNDVVNSLYSGKIQAFLWNATLPDEPTSSTQTIHELFSKRLSLAKGLIPGLEGATYEILIAEYGMICRRFSFGENFKYFDTVEILSGPGNSKDTVKLSLELSGRHDDTFSRLNFLRRSLLPLIVIAFYGTHGLTCLEVETRPGEAQWYADSGFKNNMERLSSNNMSANKWYLQKGYNPKRKLHNLDLKDKDLETLDAGNWLNDQVMNAYMLVITDKLPGVVAVGTHFYTTTMNIGNFFADMLLAPVLLFPIHVDGNHWIAGYLDRRTKVLSMYDPMSPSIGNTCTCDFVRVFKRTMTEHGLPVGIKTEYPGGPTQTDGYNCGILSCKWLERQANGVERSLESDEQSNQRTWSGFRQDMRRKLVEYLAASVSVPSVSTGTEWFIDDARISESESKIADSVTLTRPSSSNSVPRRKSPRVKNAKSPTMKLQSPVLDRAVVVHDSQTQPRSPKVVTVQGVKKSAKKDYDRKSGAVSKGFPQAWL